MNSDFLLSRYSERLRRESKKQTKKEIANRLSIKMYCDFMNENFPLFQHAVFDDENLVVIENRVPGDLHDVFQFAVVEHSPEILPLVQGLVLRRRQADKHDD